ncbi:hypothetical protein PPSIR1_20794 [Plesiocystis pacifica SIR-1]|uniref:Uncharacterized protein n=1 Tax=Plesiocystis pacifica SIR-1 TaxID=391625 RepID=A6GGS4_9BACT|nr:hypothetical protein PPSIR1_20794 [Plesiocystis pacifica SIR-1]
MASRTSTRKKGQSCSMTRASATSYIRLIVNGEVLGISR